MSTRWIPQVSSDTTRLIGVALGASIATFAVLEIYRSANTRRRRDELKKQVAKDVYGQRRLSTASAKDRIELDSLDLDELDLSNSRSTVSDPRRDLPYDESLIREQLSRNYSFFGEEAMTKVRGGRVVIVGCGGVGSWAAVMLVRSGVSSLRLIDFDMVTLSSLNRHAVAELADVGTPKVVACKRFFQEIAPWVDVDVRQELWQPGTQGERLLAGDVDWVIDAIDNISTKVELLKYCHKKGIKIFASMGAGAKCDPTRVQIRYTLCVTSCLSAPLNSPDSDISNTYEDPLARSVRRGLRMDGILDGIPVVYSTEIPGDVKLLPLAEDEVAKGDIHELGPFDNFRVRILPVLGPLPAIFGLHIATYVICNLAGKPILNPLANRNRKKLYEKLVRDLTAREAKGNSGMTERLPIDETDVSFVFEDLNRGRSSIPPHPIVQRPFLSRWDATKPLSVDNCVVLSAEELKRLDRAGGRGCDVPEWANGVSAQTANAIVDARILEAKEWLKAIS
ncbi:hypothetical protein FRB99_006152 [Tulasnella sp. 403]|nr:hypothetical protein FRB99_006152 [Tulasnella sp. 403]